MPRGDNNTFPRESVVVYCSSVFGGFSWGLTDTSDIDGVRAACEMADEEMGSSLACFTLEQILSGSTGDYAIDSLWKDFVQDVVNGEYWEFEDDELSKDDLSLDNLLKPGKRELLEAVLRSFFATSYTTDFDKYLRKHGISVIMESE